MPQMKYEKHNARQLFVEKGIERVSFSAVADSCGIARATLYKYFPDKESLLWAIHRQALRTFGNALLARAEARPLTALERFSVYFEELARRFELDPEFLLFFDSTVVFGLVRCGFFLFFGMFFILFLCPLFSGFYAL